MWKPLSRLPSVSKDPLDPVEPPVPEHLPLRDPEQPRLNIATIEVRKPSSHDEKNLLGQVLHVGARCPERVEPHRYLIEPLVVESRELGLWRACHPAAFL